MFVYIRGTVSHFLPARQYLKIKIVVFSLIFAILICMLHLKLRIYFLVFVAGDLCILSAVQPPGEQTICP
jgi:hypothetical protein